MRLKRQPRDSPRLPAIWPAIVWRGAAVVGSIGLLAVIAYESGKGVAAKPSTGFWHALTTTITKPAASIPLASLLVVGIASFWRRIWFELLVRKPGPILVRDFSVSSDVSDVDLAQLMTKFRTRLAQLRLHAPTPVPGATAPQDFLAMLDGEHLDAKNPLGSVVSILRATIPTHAYEVSVALVEEPTVPPERPRRGVTAQVTRLPHEAIMVDPVWSSSWDEAVIQAADMVTAALLPRTVLSNRAPWSGWRRYPMPSLLVHHFETAQELTSHRQYDEALDRYFQALELDPKNVDLRLQKGFVEEKLGLYLDAVATYAAARRIADETSSKLYHLSARRNRKASGRIACYRLAVLLGGVKFAHQWRKEGKGALRDKQRLLLRQRLDPELKELLEDHGLIRRAGDRHTIAATGHPPWEPEYVSKLLDEFGTELDDDCDPRYYALRSVLLHVAKKELESLQRYLRFGRGPRTWLTALSVRLIVGWVDLRREYVEHKLQQLNGGAGPPALRLDQPAQPVVTKPSTAWIPDPAQKFPKRRPRFQTWTERYNAACLYALPLLVNGEPLADERRRAFGKQAIEHLTHAMSSTVSWHAAEQRDWVLSEDPDLDGLRGCLEFKHFEATYFPSPSRSPMRPKRVHRWEQSRYTNQLLAQTARRWEAVWHQRRAALTPPIDPHVVIQWCADEAEAWRLVEGLAKDYRHWPVRCGLIEQMKVWSDKYGFERLDVEVPRFASRNQSAHDGVDDPINQEINDNERRLRELVARLGTMCGQLNNGQNGQTETHPQRRQLERLQAQLRDREFWARAASTVRLEQLQRSQLERLQNELRNRDFWNRAAPKLFLPSVCDVHAAMWQRLHEWVEETPYQDREAGSAFAAAMSQAARLSGTFHGLWVLAVIDRRVRLVTSGIPRGAATPSNGTSAPQSIPVQSAEAGGPPRR